MRHAAIALGLTGLLLMVLAGAHAALHSASWGSRWQSWERQVAERWRRTRGGSDAWLHAVQGAVAIQRAVGKPGRPAMLHVTLELPNHQLLDVREDSTLEEIVQKLLAGKAGELPTGIEVVSVQRVTRRRTSPLRATLRAVAAALPVSWKLVGRDRAGPGSAREHPAKEGGEEGGEEAPSRLGGEEALSVERWGGGTARESSTAAVAAPKASGGLGGGTAGFELDEDVVYAVPQRRQVATDADGTPLAVGIQRRASLSADAWREQQRLPMTAFDDAYVDGEDGGAPGLTGRRLQQQPQEEVVEGEEEEEEAWTSMTLFGPPRSAAQLAEQQRREGQAEAATEAAGEAGSDATLADEPEPPLVLVRVTLVHRQQALRERRFWLRGSSAAAGVPSLLDQLALEAGQPAAGDGGEAPLGRRAGASHGWGAYLFSLAASLAADPAGGSAPQEQPQWEVAGPLGSPRPAGSAPSPALLATFDGLFAGALLAAAVCLVLLAADIRRNGWRPRQAQAQQLPQLVVVAADEVAAVAPTSCAANLLV